jgi:Na+-driven multidrug efflux pump
MIFGPDLIVVLLIMVILWGVPIWAVVDAASHTSGSFRAAGSSKALWITLLIVFMFFFAPVGIILAFVYLVSVRPRVRRYA